MKKRVFALATASLLAVGYAGATNLIVDGKAVQSDVPPVITDGRTLVPVRALFESLGATVGWDDATQTATATKGATVISIQIGSQTAYVNGTATALDVPAQTIDGRTMVPARFAAESLGARVQWNESTETVSIITVPGAASEDHLVYLEDIAGDGNGSLEQQYVEQFNQDNPVEQTIKEWVSLSDIQQAGGSFNILLYDDFVIQKGFLSYKMPSLPDDFMQNPKSGIYDGIRIEVRDGTLYFNQTDLLREGAIKGPIIQYVMTAR